MKSFLSFTAIIEALTGIGLLFFPGMLVSFLLQKEFNETGGIIVAMVAGGAILSMAIGSWLFKQNEAALTFSKILLIYNLPVVVIVIFGFVFLKFTAFHFC